MQGIIVNQWQCGLLPETISIAIVKKIPLSMYILYAHNVFVESSQAILALSEELQVIPKEG
jgi:hypothetical protein